MSFETVSDFYFSVVSTTAGLVEVSKVTNLSAEMFGQLLSLLGVLFATQATGLRCGNLHSHVYGIHGSRSGATVMVVENGGRWGGWCFKEFCKPGTYANGFIMKVSLTTCCKDLHHDVFTY